MKVFPYSALDLPSAFLPTAARPIPRNFAIFHMRNCFSYHLPLNLLPHILIVRFSSIWTPNSCLVLLLAPWYVVSLVSPPLPSFFLSRSADYLSLRSLTFSVFQCNLFQSCHTNLNIFFFHESGCHISLPNLHLFTLSYAFPFL